jgi:hypothetical protein
LVYTFEPWDADNDEMKLSEFLWWPKEWTKDDIFSSHHTVPGQQVRQAAFLVACKLTQQGLLLELDH